MKKLIIPGLVAAAIVSLSACTTVNEKKAPDVTRSTTTTSEQTTVPVTTSTTTTETKSN